MRPEMPGRFGSTEQGDFNDAYLNRPFLHWVVLALWCLVVALVGMAVWWLAHAAFLKAFGAVVLAVAGFAIWGAVHNWALTHPKAG